MPIQNCSEGGKPGYKWGNQGKCYVYTSGDPSSEKQAKHRAMMQGVAEGEFDKSAYEKLGENDS